MPEIQTKRFLSIAFHRFPLSIDKIASSLTIFIDFVFYLFSTPESNYTRNWGYFERAADLNREKLGKIKKPGQYRPSEQDFKAGFLKKDKVFSDFFLKSDMHEISKRKRRVIDFYRFIDTIDINQIRFTDFYRFID